MTFSDSHLEIYETCEQIASKTKSIQQFAKELKLRGISYENHSLQTGRELLIFTGSSGYDIVGVSVRMVDRHIRVEEIGG